LNFHVKFLKISEMKNFMKILSLWLSKADRRTDGRTDIMKLIDAFHNFTKTP